MTFTGCPCFIRMDRGTENGCVAAAQYAFRAMFAGNETAERSFLYGRSPSNVVCVLSNEICIVTSKNNIL